MEQLKGKHKKMQKKMKNTQDQSSEENPDTPQKNRWNHMWLNPWSNTHIISQKEKTNQPLPMWNIQYNMLPFIYITMSA